MLAARAGRKAFGSLTRRTRAELRAPFTHVKGAAFLLKRAFRHTRTPETLLPCAASAGVRPAGQTKGGGGARWQHTNREDQRGWWSGAGGIPLSWSFVASATAAAGVGTVVLCKEFSAGLPTGIISVEDIHALFEVGNVLGEGGFAAVYRAKDKTTKQEIALKVMDKSNPEVPLVMRDEVEVMRAAGLHDNLVGLHNTYETPRSYVLVLDLADGGALFDRVVEEGKLSEKEASSYLLQVLEAILHMHRRKICHGDIKPENLLLTSDDPNASIKICDFGMARFIETGQSIVLNQNTGTMDYWSPEIVRNAQCGQGIDMWALGVVSYIMLCGCNPFDPHGSATDSQILTSITKGALDEKNPVWKVLSADCKDLIKGLLTVDPAMRLTADQAIQHRWLVGGNASDKALPGVHNQRLLGYQALIAMRNTMKALRIDTDSLFNALSKDGEMDENDLKKAFKSVGAELSDAAINAVMELADVSGDGKIDREEFRGLMKVSRATGGGGDLDEGQIKQLFTIFDENGDGKISATEMTHVLSMLGRKMSIRRASSIIKSKGASGIFAMTSKKEGAEEGLSYDDFKKVMRGKLFEDDKDD